MDSAFAWIGQLVEYFGQFVPRWVILDTTEGAVKFVGGKTAVALGPGIHWYWPLMTTIQHYPTARQADDLRAQTIVTTDDKTVVVSGVLIYEVADIEKLLAHTHSAASTVTDIALTAIHDVCCQCSWEDLKARQRKGTLDTELRNTSQKALNDYGVRVIKTMLIDLAPCRVVKLMQTPREGIL